MPIETKSTPVVFTHFRTEKRRSISDLARVTFVSSEGETVGRGTARIVDLSTQGARLTEIEMENEEALPPLPCRVLFQFLEGPFLRRPGPLLGEE